MATVMIGVIIPKKKLNEVKAALKGIAWNIVRQSVMTDTDHEDEVLMELDDLGIEVQYTISIED